MRLRYVLTGGPGFGKTSIINELSKRGYNTINEAAEEIIAEGFLDPHKNKIAFELEVEKRDLKNYFRTKEGVNFYDRGMVDAVPFRKFKRIPQDKRMIENWKILTYDKIFLIEPLQEYQQNSLHWESFEESMLIHRLIERTYLDFGYNLIRVPSMKVKERTDLILSNI